MAHVSSGLLPLKYTSTECYFSSTFTKIKFSGNTFLLTYGKFLGNTFTFTQVKILVNTLTST